MTFIQELPKTIRKHRYLHYNSEQWQDYSNEEVYGLCLGGGHRNKRSCANPTASRRLRITALNHPVTIPCAASVSIYSPSNENRWNPAGWQQLSGDQISALLLMISKPSTTSLSLVSLTLSNFTPKVVKNVPHRIPNRLILRQFRWGSFHQN